MIESKYFSLRLARMHQNCIKQANLNVKFKGIIHSKELYIQVVLLAELQRICLLTINCHRYEAINLALDIESNDTSFILLGFIWVAKINLHLRLFDRAMKKKQIQSTS